MRQESMEKRAVKINKIICERGYEFRIEYKSIVKNNGRKDAYLFVSQDNNIVSVVQYYADEWWYKSDQELVEYFHDIFLEKSFYIDPNTYFSRQSILDNVLPKLVSQKNIIEFRKEKVVFLPILDMLLTFYLPLQEKNSGILTVKITEEFLNTVTIYELKKAAIRNIEKSYQIITMEDMLQKMGESITINSDDDSFMYILTNKFYINGASSIISDTIMRELSHKMKTEEIILFPSSVHEMIAIPWMEDMSFEFMINMVKDSNHMVVAEEDVLTDSVYIWRSGRFTVLH